MASWRVFRDRLLLGRCLLGFVLPIFEYWYAVWCLAADTHHKQLNRVISGASSLPVGVFDCDIAYRLSVAVLCILVMVLFLGSMCQCRLHAVLWSRIATLKHLLAAEPHITSWLLFPCQYLCGQGYSATYIYNAEEISLKAFLSLYWVLHIHIVDSVYLIIIYP